MQQSLKNTIADLTTQRSALLATFTAIPSISAQLHPKSTQNGSQISSSASSTASLGAVKDPRGSEDDEATLDLAKTVINRHIKLLHTYNEIRDIGQGLMGLIADARGVRIKEVQEEFGIDGKD